MQGERPLPYPVIEKFASTQGEIANNVFLLSTRVYLTFRCRSLPGPTRQIRDCHHTAWPEDRLSRWSLRCTDLRRVGVPSREFIRDAYDLPLTTETGFLLAILYKTHHREIKLGLDGQVDLRTTKLLVLGSDTGCCFHFIAH